MQVSSVHKCCTMSWSTNTYIIKKTLFYTAWTTEMFDIYKNDEIGTVMSLEVFGLQMR